MRKLVASLLAAIALVVAPLQADNAQAHHLDADLQQLVTWAGCTAPLVTSDEVSIFSSFYSYGVDGRGLYIGTYAGDTPMYVYLTVLFHEIGHCLQHQWGYVNLYDDVTIELDADRLAADLACSLGLDGRRMLHDTFVWAYEQFGYEGDESHGTLAERISQMDNAANCRVDHQQPYQAR